MMRIDSSYSEFFEPCQVESGPRGTSAFLEHARRRGFLVPPIFAFYRNRIQYDSLESGMHAIQYIAGHISILYSSLFTKEGQDENRKSSSFEWSDFPSRMPTAIEVVNLKNKLNNAIVSKFAEKIQYQRLMSLMNVLEQKPTHVPIEIKKDIIKNDSDFSKLGLINGGVLVLELNWHGLLETILIENGITANKYDRPDFFPREVTTKIQLTPNRNGLFSGHIEYGMSSALSQKY